MRTVASLPYLLRGPWPKAISTPRAAGARIPSGADDRAGVFISRRCLNDPCFSVQTMSEARKGRSDRDRLLRSLL